MKKIISTFLVPSAAVRTSFKDNALNSACSLNIFLKSLFKPTKYTFLATHKSCIKKKKKKRNKTNTDALD